MQPPAPSKFPVQSTTTMSKPTHVQKGCASSNINPSMYQTASKGQSRCYGRIHSKTGPLMRRGKLILSVRRPRVNSKRLRSAPNRAKACSAEWEGVGQPSAGIVLGQQRRCSNVPTVEKQSWHLLSSVKAFTWAKRACGHCPQKQLRPSMAQT